MKRISWCLIGLHCLIYVYLITKTCFIIITVTNNNCYIETTPWHKYCLLLNDTRVNTDGYWGIKLQTKNIYEERKRSDSEVEAFFCTLHHVEIPFKDCTFCKTTAFWDSAYFCVEHFWFDSNLTMIKNIEEWFISTRLTSSPNPTCTYFVLYPFQLQLIQHNQRNPKYTLVTDGNHPYHRQR